MAEKRMMSKSFANSARFMQMSNSAKLLYFYLNLNADDDGIVEVYAYSQMLHTPEDDVRILVQKEFIIFINDDWLAFLPHWLQNQTLRNDRFIPSIYRNQLINRFPNIIGKLKTASIEQMSRTVQTEVLSEVYEYSGIPHGNQKEPQGRLDQNKLNQINLDKDSIDKLRLDELMQDPYRVACKTTFLDPKSIETIAYKSDSTSQQNAEYIRIIEQTKNTVERELDILIDSEKSSVATNEMLKRLFDNINDKKSKNKEINELAYVNTTSKNHWEKIAEEQTKREKRERTETLEALGIL